MERGYRWVVIRDDNRDPISVAKQNMRRLRRMYQKRLDDATDPVILQSMMYKVELLNCILTDMYKMKKVKDLRCNIYR